LKAESAILWTAEKIRCHVFMACYTVGLRKTEQRRKDTEN